MIKVAAAAVTIVALGAGGATAQRRAPPLAWGRRYRVVISGPAMWTAKRQPFGV
jgi:hypothetical protein